jgi:hypothetical protein
MKINPKYFIVVVAVLWLLMPVIVYLALPSWAERGQFGDVFGSVNALFSGMAFVGIFWSFHIQQEQLLLQQQELKLQREELRLQREEMVASRGELANQARAQKALFEVSISQIAVASAQARIEAIKMQSETKAPHSRHEFVEQITAIADSLGELERHVVNKVNQPAENLVG